MEVPNSVKEPSFSRWRSLNRQKIRADILQKPEMKMGEVDKAATKRMLNFGWLNRGFVYF